MVTRRRIPLAPEQKAHYAAALRALTDAGIEFLVGGGFALFLHLRQWRATKDLDLFVRAGDVRAALACLSAAGFVCELIDPAWLAKAGRGGAPVDLIFCSYNGLFPVDETWFESRHRGDLLGVPVRLVAPEEMILSKSFVAARDRFDGSDIAWLIREHGRRLDWDRIERGMRDHGQVLLWQLVHSLYVFPSVREVVPQELLSRLIAQFEARISSPESRGACRGPMLDPLSYQVALERAGEPDPRPREDLVIVSDAASGDEPAGAEVT